MEVSTGLHFVSYAHECILTNSISFIEQLSEHLIKNGVDLSETTIQTDNGSEFIGAPNGRRMWKQFIATNFTAHTA